MDADYEREIAVNEVWVVPAGKEKLHVLALRPRRQLIRNIPRIWVGSSPLAGGELGIVPMRD